MIKENIVAPAGRRIGSVAGGYIIGLGYSVEMAHQLEAIILGITLLGWDIAVSASARWKRERARQNAD